MILNLSPWLAIKIFWKINYYAPDLEQGSHDPSDPEKIFRVLTIMEAREY